LSISKDLPHGHSYRDTESNLQEILDSYRHNWVRGPGVVYLTKV